MVFVKFHNMNRKKKFLMSPLNSNSKIFTLQQVKTMLQSQFKNVQFSFLFFNLCTDVLSILLKMSVLSFLFFFSICCVQQCSSFFSFFFFPSFFPLSCRFLFLFSFFFFIMNCSFNVPFFSTLYLPLCLYLNTITIGSLPSLFNFSLYYHKLSLIYNTTFSIAYEHSSFFFLFTKYPGVFF